ncbi:MAG: hypothetical protein WC824_05380 [Bacteroidota bacterium]|jgi:hypothetical protein
MERSKKTVKQTGQTAGRPAAKEFNFTRIQRRLLTWAFPALAMVAGLLYALPMAGTVGENGFPFDDAYTALTFARNLLEHGAYSFFGSTGVTSGVTSGVTAPLQVFLLALIGFVTGEGITASFILGIASFAAVAGLTFLLGLRLFRDREWIAAAAALLIVLSPQMASAAVSGLPTLLLTALLLASGYFYFARQTMLFFLFAGLALWVRPDALVFFLAAIVHLLYSHLAVTQEHKPVFEGERAVTGRETAIGAIVYLLLAAGYVVFNIALSGSIFVNPVSAKMTYFANASSAFTSEIWKFYSHSWAAAVMLFAMFGSLMIAAAMVRRRSAPLLMSAAFVVGSIAAYGFLFPIILDDHTLLPTLPFFTLIGVWGIWYVFDLIAAALPLPFMRFVARSFVTVIVAIAAVIAVIDWSAYRHVHYRSVRYVLDRSVAAGRWIGANTPEDVRVATHLPGAVSYYGDRYVVDVTGKLTPALIEHMNSMAELVAMLRKNRVQFVAAQRDVFEVVNTNPVFSSDPTQPGFTEVYPYTPGRTHLMSQTASSLNLEAAQLMARKQWREAAAVLQRSFKEDPYSSRTSTLYGLAILQLGDTLNARTYLGQALMLHGEYAPAMVPLGDILVRQKEYTQGIRLLEQASELNPASVQARSSLRAAYQARRTDSLAARGIYSYTFTQ